MQKGFAPILVIVGIGVILAFGAVFLVILGKKSSNTRNTTSPTPSVIVEKIARSQLPTVKPTSNTGKQRASNELLLEPKAEIPDSWDTYKGTYFTLRYPKDWRIMTNTVQGGGINILIKPAYLLSSEYYPSLSILASNAPIDAVLSKDVPLYKQYGLVQSNVVLQEFHSVKLSGTLTKQVVGDKMIDKPSQETQYYLAIGTTSYIMKYKYDSTVVNGKQEALFAQIISTLQFTPTK